MSANNEVIILEKKNKYEVHINSCVDMEFIPNKETLIKKFEDLKEACKFAQKYARKERIEYGVRLDLR